jgi:hypothetical protein
MVPGCGDTAREFNDRDVGFLGQLTQPVERFLRVDLVALYKHALGLTDDVARGQGVAELDVAPLPDALAGVAPCLFTQAALLPGRERVANQLHARRARHIHTSSPDGRPLRCGGSRVFLALCGHPVMHCAQKMQPVRSGPTPAKYGRALFCRARRRTRPPGLGEKCRQQPSRLRST